MLKVNTPDIDFLGGQAIAPGESVSGNSDVNGPDANIKGPDVGGGFGVEFEKDKDHFGSKDNQKDKKKKKEYKEGFGFKITKFP